MFEDDLSCPVCTEVFRDPVLLSCGHSFCRQCITDPRTSKRAIRCLVCQQVSPQSPVSNLCLRDTCESYLRERNKSTESDGEHKCLVHGEKIELFCQTDEEAICSRCKKREHGQHKTQPLQQAVRQRKVRNCVCVMLLLTDISLLCNLKPRVFATFNIFYVECCLATTLRLKKA